MYREKLIAVAAIWFALTVLSKVARTLNSKVEIRINLATGLNFKANSVFIFDWWILVIASTCLTFMFFLVPL